jgi:assimilatory nitrate reductase catalytic subunit
VVKPVQAVPNIILKTSETGIKTTCPYCGVGCGVHVREQDEKMILKGDAQHPANFGKLCIKGKNLLETTDNHNRLSLPELNGASVSWDTALAHVANGFAQTIKKYGPQSVAFYVSGQLLTEDYYLANKLMKGFIGTGNIDTNSRLCMSSAVAAHKRAFGEDIVPMSYSDITKADLVIVTGSNLAWCHPIIFKRIREEKERRPALKVIVIDPRHTASCEIADLHLPVSPGGDLVLFNALLNFLADNDGVKNNVGAGLEEALKSAAIDAQKVIAIGLSNSDINLFFNLFNKSEKVVTLFSQGINQSEQGVDQGNAIINCHLASGKIGKVGSGPFSITGQPNAMGGREVGALCNTLASHIEFTDTHLYPALQNFWQTKNIATKPGLKAVDLFDALDDGKIKAIWIMATNPALSMPDINKVKAALAKCPLVVVSDCVADNDTLSFANVKLPAHCWGEKSGTVTNSERRISRQRSFLKPFKEAKADWWIIAEVAKKMGFVAPFTYQDERAVFAEYAALSGLENNGSRLFDISAFEKITLSQYQNLSPTQWPQSNSAMKVVNDQLLFSDNRYSTPSKQANLIAVQCRKFSTIKEKNDVIQITTQPIFTLNTGRLRDHWHTQTRTAKSALLSTHYPEPLVEIHPEDAIKYHIKDQSLISLASNYATVIVRAKLSPLQKQGNLFMPIHWTSTQSAQGGVCQIIAPKFDALSGQPAFKHSQVELKRFATNSEAVLLVKEKITKKISFYQIEQKVEEGYCYHLASNSTPESFLEDIKNYLLNEVFANYRNALQSISGEDKKTQYYRHSYYLNGEVEAGIFVAENKCALPDGWISQFFNKEHNNLAKRQILSANVTQMNAKKVFCQCLKIPYSVIEKTLQGNHSLQRIRELTGAGNGCGSCIGDISLMLAQQNYDSQMFSCVANKPCSL